MISRRARAPEQPKKKAGGHGRGTTIRDAADVERWAHGRIAELDYEEAWVLVIDAQHKLLRAQRMGRGSAGLTEIDVHHVVRSADVPHAAGFILVHNHPSDIPKPGKADIDTSLQVLQLAKQQRGPRLLDSVIVGRTSHSSLLNLGMLSSSRR